jgi:hypothetical protein
MLTWCSTKPDRLYRADTLKVTCSMVISLRIRSSSNSNIAMGRITWSIGVLLISPGLTVSRPDGSSLVRLASSLNVLSDSRDLSSKLLRASDIAFVRVRLALHSRIVGMMVG